MTTNQFEDDLDDDGDDLSQLPKKLRAQIKAQAKQIADLTSANADLTKKTRTTAVKDILKDAGVKPQLARFVLADVEDPTEETVTEWLKENGEIFGVTLDDGESSSTQQVQGMSPDELKALAQINQFSVSNGSNGAVSNVDEAAKAIKSADSEEALMDLIRSMQGV